MQNISNLLLLRNAAGTDVIEVNNIIRIEASSNYSKIHFANGKILVSSKVLKWFEHALIDKGFTRVHRSHLVNEAWIQTFNCQANMSVVLQNQEQIHISKRKKKMVVKALLN
jgi:two-component system, LytTR family, response regulator